MKQNWVREKVLSREPAVRAFAGLGSPTIVFLAMESYSLLRKL